MATAVADISDPRKAFVMEAETIALFNPTTLTLPILRSREDANILTKIYRRIPILSGSEITETEGWKVSFGSMFHMSNDSNLFQAVGRYDLLPLFEAKMFWHFDHRWSSFDGVEDTGSSLSERRDAEYEPSPRYWIEDHEVMGRLSEKGWTRKWMIASRNVSDSRNERTFVTSILPIGGLGHSGSVWALANDDPALASCLLANFNSLVLDFVARQKIPGMNISYFMIHQFPILPPAFYNEPRLAFITPKVLELTYTSYSLAPFARDLGHDGRPFAWDEDRRAHMRADLDAFYARAYGLDRDELRYILDPAEVKGPDYPSETFRVLKEKEIRQFGEYRTRRLVLEAWDRMAADGTFVNLELGAGQIAGTTSNTQRPVLAALPDGAWARAAQQPNDAFAALTAILKAIDGPTRSRSIRLAAAMMLEPNLLTSLLPETQQRDWRRLVGQEAEPRVGNVVGFAARANQGWGVAVSNHRGNNRLIENMSAGTWAPGPGLDAFDTAGWPDGRAGFVLEALRQLDLDQTVTSMPDEVRGWITHAAAT